jgi:hypothetical protein
VPKDRVSWSDRFYDIAQKLFREIDQEAIMAEVKALRETKPGVSRRELAMFMTRKAAQKTAVIGAAAAATPGPIGLIVMAPDIFNLVRQQSRLVLSIAFLYDQKPDLRERFREVLATLAIATGASAAKKGSQALVARAIRESAARKLARRIAGRYVSRRFAAIAAPAVGFAIGATLNYMAVRSVGIAAQKYYSGALRRQNSVKAKKTGRKRETTAARKPTASRRTASSRKR